MSKSRVGAGYLTIHAERHDKTEGKHRSEFRYGAFTRSLPLPANANEDGVQATYHDGILTISVGLRVEKQEPVKKIEVKAADMDQARIEHVLGEGILFAAVLGASRLDHPRHRVARVANFVSREADGASKEEHHRTIASIDSLRKPICERPALSGGETLPSRRAVGRAR